MPTELTAHAALIWFAAGFFVGLGWAIAAGLVCLAMRKVG